MKRSPLPLLVAAALIGAACLALYTARIPLRGVLFDLTGEEHLAAQVKGLADLVTGLVRPRLDLATDAAIQHANVNPFGVNVFLNEEVEPEKRERSVRLASEAGYHWLRQEFPWQDIEIHGKGDFEDRRNTPARSAWDKYDHIVDLAEKYGMELIVRVSTPPAWTRARGDAVGAFAPPDNFEDLGDFLHALVGRYKGRVRCYQIWNEPNIHPEWGDYPISPEDYTELLKVAATRARAADPDVVIIAAALAGTIALQPDAPAPNNALDDLVYLQRMYDAGAAPFFDIMSTQAYGLWSGPTDRRMNPRVMNFGRPQYIRDVMVANGDAQKPIWISEMAWNAVPDEVADKRFGQVTPEQQARYLPLAYQRLIDEWPWVGVASTWYLKRATDDWLTAARPEAYFRLADPDFSVQPVYESMKRYLSSVRPALAPGLHQAEGWGISTAGVWQTADAPELPFGRAWWGAETDARLSFVFRGTGLTLHPACQTPACAGTLRVVIDGGKAADIALADEPVTVARNLPAGEHSIELKVVTAPAGLAAIGIRGGRPIWPAAMALLFAAALAVLVGRRSWRHLQREEPARLLRPARRSGPSSEDRRP